MDDTVPREIIDAIAAGVWRDPGPVALQQLLGEALKLPELELFEDIATMRRVAAQLEAAGFVDDPEFCMTRGREPGTCGRDPRLVFGAALFIAGSRVPGDDLFAVVDWYDRAHEPVVRVFDWSREVPGRWVLVGRLSELVERLSRYWRSPVAPA